MSNTKKSGVYEFLVYSDHASGTKKNYVGVCLTLDIIEEGPDPRALMQSVIEAAEGHILAVIENNLDDSLLNRPAPRQYWDKYRKFQQFVASRTRRGRQQADGVLAWQMTRPIEDLAYA